MGNQQGHSLISNAVGNVLKPEENNIEISQELIDEDNQVLIDIQSIEIKKQQLKTRQETIKMELIELYPRLVQGNREILSSVRRLRYELNNNEVELIILEEQTDSLSVRIISGLCQQKILELMYSELRTEEMTNKLKAMADGAESSIEEHLSKLEKHEDKSNS